MNRYSESRMGKVIKQVTKQSDESLAHFPRGHEQDIMKARSGHSAYCSCHMIPQERKDVIVSLRQGHFYPSLIPHITTTLLSGWCDILRHTKRFPVIHPLAALTFHAQLSNAHFQFQ